MIPFLIVTAIVLALVAFIIRKDKQPKPVAPRLTPNDPKLPESWQVTSSMWSGYVPKVTAHPDGVAFDIPTHNTVNYATHVHGSIKGSKFVLRYRLEADEGVRVYPKESATADPTLCLYFQRYGDDWGARGEMEHYRWWATHVNRSVLLPGEHEIELPLDPANWKSVFMQTGTDQPEAFRAALSNAERAGFTLGGGGSAGHGIMATGPARLVIMDFSIQ